MLIFVPVKQKHKTIIICDCCYSLSYRPYGLRTVALTLNQCISCSPHLSFHNVAFTSERQIEAHGVPSVWAIKKPWLVICWWEQISAWSSHHSTSNPQQETQIQYPLIPAVSHMVQRLFSSAALQHQRMLSYEGLQWNQELSSAIHHAAKEFLVVSKQCNQDWLD